MSSDLQRSLENASVGPASPLDMKRIYESARKRTRIARLGMIGGLVVAALASGGMYRAMSIGQNTERPVGPVGSTSPSPDDEGCFYDPDAGSGEEGVTMSVRICPDPDANAEEDEECFSLDDEPSREEDAEIHVTPACDESDTYVDDDDRVSVRVPRGWQVASENLTPNLEDPREILSLGTSALLPGGRCAQQPARTLDAIGPSDAFISVQERKTSSTHEPRPESFRNKLEGRIINFEACTDTRDFRVYWYAFNDEGRDLYLFAALGDRAGRARTDDFWETIESLDFSYPDQSGASETPCSDVHATPSYLPWVAPQDEIPTAETFRTPNGRGTTRLWSPSRGSIPVRSVEISVYSARQTIRGRKTNIRFLDARGYLDTYATGDVAISWDLGGRSCNWITLELNHSGGSSPTMTEREVVKIARSLRYGEEILATER